MNSYTHISIFDTTNLMFIEKSNIYFKCMKNKQKSASEGMGTETEVLGAIPALDAKPFNVNLHRPI